MSSHLPRRNLLLDALPDTALDRLLPQLEWDQMPLDRVLRESGSEMAYAYFPTTAVVSLTYETEDGSPIELAVVGNEGMVGVELFLGGRSTPSRAVVRSAGQAFRLPARAIKNEFDQAGPVMHLLLRYTQALISQMAQTAVCNRHHSMEQRLCRWLLMGLDRVQGNELVVTHDRIASMLGVRREGVTESAFALQRLGLISYARGHIVALDRNGLEQRACECYAVVKKEYERMFPETLATRGLWPARAATRDQTTAPNSAPTPAVIAIARAPQNETRHAPTRTPAPPARAAMAPNEARNASDMPDTQGISPRAGANAVTAKGRSAPTEKLAADANAA
jgi:CRP-like cAMP-binding protein